jgi:hypothetical protein
MYLFILSVDELILNTPLQVIFLTEACKKIISINVYAFFAETA